MQNPQAWGSTLNPSPSPLAPARRTLGHRLFGGPPLTVVLRLVFVSLVVGAVLMWLDIEPMDIVWAAERAAEHLWAMGFGALDRVGRYIAAGAVIVVPVWFVTRLFTMRGTP